MAAREEHDGKRGVACAVESARQRFTTLTVMGFLGILLASIALHETRSELAATLRVVALGWVLAMLVARLVVKALGTASLRAASERSRPANDNGGAIGKKLGD